MEQIETTQSALEAAQLAFDTNPNDATFKVLDRTKTAHAIAQAQEKKSRADRESAERAAKVARLSELRTRALQHQADAEALGQKIGTIMASVWPIVRSEQTKLIDDSVETSDQIQTLTQELEGTSGPPTYVSAQAIAYACSEHVRKQALDGEDPYQLRAYLSFWGV